MARSISGTVVGRERKAAGEAPSHTHDIPASKKIKAWRMNLTAQLYLTGAMTLADISEYFLEQHGITISEGALSKDLKALQEKWQAQAMENTDTRIRAELAKLDNLELISINSLRDGGEPKNFVDTMLKLAERRSNLLGLDKAKKIDLNHKGLESLSDNQLEQIVLDGGGDGADPAESPEAEK